MSDNPFKLLGIPQTEEDAFKASEIAENVAMTLSSLAQVDKYVTITEYQALCYAAHELSRLSDHPLLMHSLFLKYLLFDLSFKDCVVRLGTSLKGQPKDLPDVIVSAAIPLIMCQHSDSETVLELFSKNLGISKKKRLDIYNKLKLLKGERSPWNKFAVLRNKRIFLNSLDRNRKLAICFNNDDILRTIEILEGNPNNVNYKNKLSEQIRELKNGIFKEIQSIYPVQDELEETLITADEVVSLTISLVDQIKHRIFFIKKRLKLQMELFEEDLRLCIENCTLEIEIENRNFIERGDNWTDITHQQRHQDSINRIFQLKTAELKRKYDKHFDLWNEELLLFSNELKYNMEKLHTNFSRFKENKIEYAADRLLQAKILADKFSNNVLGVSLIAAAGTAALISTGISTASAIATAGALAGPIGWIVGGTISISIIWKLMSDKEKRKRAQLIKDKKAIRKALDESLAPFNLLHKEACNIIESKFIENISEMYGLPMRNALITISRTQLERRIADKVLNDTNAIFDMLFSDIM